MSDLRALVDAVRERIDLVELIGRDVKLQKAGSILKGSSPFRTDRNPSFIVWPHTQSWRDFSGGSNDGGDCLDYVMLRDGASFWEALHALAIEAGVDLPAHRDQELNAELERISERRRCERLLTEAARYYHRVLPSKIKAAWYAQRYGFSDETIEKLLLGWADGHLYEHFRGTLGTSDDEALATGLFVRFRDGRISDFFQHRLVFPYWRRGVVVYFIARQTELTPEEAWEEAKYKKLLTRSEKHPYVSAFIQNDTFYNEDAATQGVERLLVTEGVTDCISAMQAGVPCISPVTVRFRNKDVPKLLGLTERVQEIVICNDSESSGAGEAGAIETAAALQAAGRVVRIARIPRPEGKAKVDLNELVRERGSEALHEVVRRAVDWCEHRIEQIPIDVPKHELSARLRELLPLLRSADPVLREGYAGLIQRRFKLRAQTVRELLKEPAEGRSRNKRRGEPSDGDELARGNELRGEVLEDTDHYYVLDRQGAPVTISTFHIEPVRRIVTDEGDIIDADVTTTSGRSYQGVRFPRESWHSKRNLLRALKSADMLWTGSDDNVQGVLKLIAERSVPILRGITNLGYCEIGAQPLWVAPESVVAEEGREAPEDVVFVDAGDALHKRMRRLECIEREEELSTAAVVLPLLLELNTADVILPILGWFFATPLKPRIHKALGHFPILCVWGSPGSGKSSLLIEVFWPLFGIRSAEPFSATETEFALVKLLSSTNSVPVFIDEYKPFDMPKHRRNALHRYMRRLYTGEAESRGRADQTVVTYRLHAPLCLAGETRPIESALVERIITANPSKDTLLENPSFVRAFHKLKSMDVGILTRGIIRHLLKRDTRADLRMARRVVEETLSRREVPLRMKDNLIAVMCGLLHFESYAKSLGASVPELDVAAFIEAQCDDLLESGGRMVKSGLDYFLEILSSLAVSGAIQYDRQYTYSGGQLALHIPSCHAAYAEHCRRIGYEGEVLDKKALIRQLQECHRRGGYVTHTSWPTSFGSRADKRRAALIDLEAAKQMLDVDDFPQGEREASTGSYMRSWYDG